MYVFLPEVVHSVKKILKNISVKFGVSVLLFAVGFQAWTTYDSSLTSSSLPNNTPYFIGREKEVQNISHLLSFLETTGSNEENPNMVNIIGAPGFGKSTLAIAVGNELLKRGIHVHYVDLNGVDTSQDATSTILATVTNKLEVINNKDHVRWAKNVHRKTLLILDNCDELMKDDIINVFLKTLTEMLSMSHSLRLLTTARYNYTGTVLDVSVSFAVEPLSKKSATQLLLNMTTHANLSVASVLVNLTGRAALAVKIVGGLLKEGESADELVNELSMRPIETLSPKEFRPEDRIRVIIASSFRRLPSLWNQSIAMLAQIPGSFDESAAAAVLNVNTSTARKEYLKPIAKRCLLEFSDHVKRYHMHKLIKDFVIEELNKLVNSQIVRSRLFSHYFERLFDLAGRYDQNPREVLQTYDYDQHNFYHVLVHLMDPSFADTASDIVRQSVATLSEQAANLFLVRLPAGQLFRWYRAVREYAVRLVLDGKNYENYCNIMLLLVEVAMKQTNRSSRITAILEEDIDFMKHCSTNLRLKMIARICLSPFELTDIPDNVLDCYDSYAPILSLPIYRNFNFWMLGSLFYSSGAKYAAYLCYVKAGLNFGEIDKRDKMNYLKSATEVFEIHDHHNKKIMLLNLIADLHEEEMTSSRQSYTMFMDMGSLYVRLSNYDSAISTLLHAYKMIKDLFKEDDAEIFRVCYLLGKAYREIKQYEEAAKYFNRSLLISKKLNGNYHWQTALCHVNLANVLADLQLDEALIHWMEAARLYETVVNDELEVFWVYLKIGFWQVRHFRPFSGAKYYYKAYRILYKTNGTKPQPEPVSGTMTKDLQTSPSFVDIWANVAANNLNNYVNALLPEDSRFLYYYGTLFLLLVYLLFHLGIIIMTIKIVSNS